MLTTEMSSRELSRSRLWHIALLKKVFFLNFCSRFDIFEVIFCNFERPYSFTPPKKKKNLVLPLRYGDLKARPV